MDKKLEPQKFNPTTPKKNNPSCAKPFEIYFDGSFSPQDKSAGIGVVVTKNGEKVSSMARGIPGKASHLAEINAMVAALDEAVKIKSADPSAFIRIFGDSSTVISTFLKRLSNISRSGYGVIGAIADETSALYDRAALTFCGLGSSVRIGWVPRSYNQMADRCSKKGRHRQTKKILAQAHAA
jgi:ribonuclease HI